MAENRGKYFLSSDIFNINMELAIRNGMVDKLIEYGADIHALSLKNTSILDACVGSEYISSTFNSCGDTGVILMFDHLIDIGAIPTS